MNSNENLLQYVAISSFIQPSFWSKLSELKINVDRLNDNHRDIWGYFTNFDSHWKKLIVEVDSTSFNTLFDGQKKYVPVHGKIFNKNTIEQFKNCDKTTLINAEGGQFVDDLKNDVILANPSKLNSFFVLSFSDLKKYVFYYWFAFPVPYSVPAKLNNVATINEHFSEIELDKIISEYETLDSEQKPYFLVRKNDLGTEISTLSENLKTAISTTNCTEYYFVYADYIHEHQPLPRCHLKNYIVFLLHYCPFLASKPVNFIAFSLELINSNQLSCRKSRVFNLTLPQCEEIDCSRWVGWEKNERSQLGPRLANMKNSLDPMKLAENSVDLNLKLMKWRLLPDIDLEKIKTIKCLLLGSGTLGCSVARALLGWGVRDITFVDNSTVSFSNPVRQSLFTYEDSVKSKPKAMAAADNLRKIFPGVNAQSFQLTIQMPGHSVDGSTLESVKADLDQLENLIQANDVVFLLMDSRESRWLPTLLGCFYNKIVVNVALGFDSYLVMRHGSRSDPTDLLLAEATVSRTPDGFKAIAGNNLGCYFCNDVTAPGNSLKDRTLDQQCTVTRPGVSMIAGALAVELTISLLQHPSGGVNVPAYYKQHVANGSNEFDLSNDDSQCVLGAIPHSIRGFLSNFTQVVPATRKFDQCTACSHLVLNAFRDQRFDFLLQVFNNGSKYLEDLTGLTDLYDSNNLIDVLEMADDEEFSDN